MASSSPSFLQLGSPKLSSWLVTKPELERGVLSLGWLLLSPHSGARCSCKADPQNLRGNEELKGPERWGGCDGGLFSKDML